MKTTTKTKTKRSSIRRPLPVSPPSELTSALRPLTSASRCSIRHHFGFWSLDFDGHRAVFDHEHHGAFYVAYLLLHRPFQLIHGMALDFKASAYFNQRPTEICETLIKNPANGRTEALAGDAIVERGFCADKRDGLAPLFRKIEELEAILEDDDASEPVKAEVQRELEELYAYQKRAVNVKRLTDAAQKTVRTVRVAIQRFHQRLATAVDPQSNPHPVLRPFADYIDQTIITPSTRYANSGRGRAKTGTAGCFIHEPPHGVLWSAS